MCLINSVYSIVSTITSVAKLFYLNLKKKLPLSRLLVAYKVFRSDVSMTSSSLPHP